MPSPLAEDSALLVTVSSTGTLKVWESYYEGLCWSFEAVGVSYEGYYWHIEGVGGNKCIMRGLILVDRSYASA